MIDPPKFNISFSCPPYKKVHIAAVCVHVVSMNVVSLPASYVCRKSIACMFVCSSGEPWGPPCVPCRKLCRESAANKRMHAECICVS